MHHILDDSQSLTAVYQINFDLLPTTHGATTSLEQRAVSGKQDCGNVRIMSFITAELKAITTRPPKNGAKSTLVQRQHRKHAFVETSLV